MQNLLLSPVPLDQLKKELVDAIKTELKTAISENATNKQEDGFLTRGEVAQLLSVSLGTIGEWTKNGKITGYRIGRRVRFKKSEVIKSLSRIKSK